jgi:hypothetical protein
MPIYGGAIRFVASRITASHSRGPANGILKNGILKGDLMDPDTARARAQAAFRKEEQAREGAKAWLEYEAEARATQEKTARLRALRLAKEAADKDASKKPRAR